MRIVANVDNQCYLDNPEYKYFFAKLIFFKVQVLKTNVSLGSEGGNNWLTVSSRAIRRV